MVVWKDINGYENIYEISSSGLVRSKDRICVDSIGRKRFRKGMILSPDVAQNGYYRVTLAWKGKKKQVYVHRLLANHFIPNVDDLPQVNHKDGDKLNNNLDNLEWVTHKENTVHAYKNGLIDVACGSKHHNYGKFGSKSKKAKSVIATNIITNEKKEYGSIIETKADGFSPSEVSRSCNHGGIHKGYSFEFSI